MLKRVPKESLPERKNPGDREIFYGSPGSIEQHLDMCESADELRGDEVIRERSAPHGGPDEDPAELTDLMELNYRMDLSEDDREGDEMSGDDHSGGLQGNDAEVSRQVHLSSAMPGHRSEREEETDIISYGNSEDQEDRAELRRGRR